MNGLDCLITSGKEVRGIGYDDFKRLYWFYQNSNGFFDRQWKNICIPVLIVLRLEDGTSPRGSRWTASRTVLRGAKDLKNLVLISHLNTLISVFYVFLNLKYALSFSIERMKTLSGRKGKAAIEWNLSGLKAGKPDRRASSRFEIVNYIIVIKMHLQNIVYK